MVDLRILKVERRLKDKLATLGVERTDFDLFRHLPGRALCDKTLEGRGAQENFFKDYLCPHNKKNFCKGVGDKRLSRENMGPLLSEMGDLVTQDMEKAEVLNAFLAPVFPSKTSLQEFQVPETRERLKQSTCILGGRGSGREYFSKQGIQESSADLRWC